MIVGGPGAAFTSMAPFFEPWEAAFTLVQWDQPGGGATWARNAGDAKGPITLERLARDGLSIAEQALARLGRQKLVLLGWSGGSVVGLDMILRRPELFDAYVGTGQFVDWALQDAAGYAMTLQRARARGDEAAVAELERIGPPPYADTATDAVKSRYAGALTAAEQAALAAAAAELRATRDPPAGASWLSPELELPDPRARAIEVYDEVRGELTAFAARRLGRRYDVPMIFLQGAEDAYSVTAEVEAFAEEITAPLVRLVRIEGAGHSAPFMREAFLAELKRQLRLLATG